MNIVLYNTSTRKVVKRKQITFDHRRANCSDWKTGDGIVATNCSEIRTIFKFLIQHLNNTEKFIITAD